MLQNRSFDFAQDDTRYVWVPLSHTCFDNYSVCELLPTAKLWTVQHQDDNTSVVILSFVKGKSE